MLPIKDILKTKLLLKPILKLNQPYEQAKRISDLVGCQPQVILRLQKQYGTDKVMGLYSYLKDLPHLDKKRAIGLITWRLKQK